MPKGKSTEKKTAALKKEGNEVELCSLAMGQLFFYQGKTYSKRRQATDGIRALSEKGTELLVLPPNTMVAPILALGLSVQGVDPEKLPDLSGRVVTK